MKKGKMNLMCPFWVNGLTWMLFFFFMGNGNTIFAAEGYSKHLATFKATVLSFDKGLAHLRKGNYEQAESEFVKCVERFPQHAYAHYYLAQIKYLKKEFASALEHIQKAKELLNFMKELNTFALENRYHKLTQQKKDINDLIGEGTMACTDRERFVDHSDNLQEKIDKLSKKLDEETLSDNRLKSSYSFLEGNILFCLQQYKSATVQYKEAISLNGENWEAYNNLAGVHFLFKEYFQALGYMRLIEARGAEMKVNLKLKKMIYQALNKPVTGIEEKEFPGGVMLFFVNVLEGGKTADRFYENTYVMWDEKNLDAVIIDPGYKDDRIPAFIKERQLHVRLILNTHGHYDHTGANRYFGDLYQVDIVGHEGDKELYQNELDKINCPTRFFKGEEAIVIYDQGLVIQVIQTPGHTSGSVCFLINGCLFSGDTLLKGSIGVLSGDNKNKNQGILISGIRDKLLPLPGETRIFPGHAQETTLNAEIKENPYLK